MTDQNHPVSLAQQYRKRRQEGTLWETPSGAKVRVRELDIADHAVVNQFPAYLRQMVYDVIERSATLRPEASDDDAANPFAGLSGDQLMQREYEIGVALCKVGWIEPEVVDEVIDEDRQISVADLDPRDRRAYMTRVFGGQMAEAQALATFPDRSAGSVGSGPDQPAVQPAPEPGDGAAAGGVLSRDSV